MVQTIINKKETSCTSKNPWEGVLKESTGGYLYFRNEEPEFNIKDEISSFHNSKKEPFATDNGITIQTLRGRVENIEKNFIMVGFEIPEEDRREYYPIDKNQISFNVRLNEIIEMEIRRSRSESKVQVRFYPYKKPAFFKKREEKLINELADLLQNLSEDDF